MKYLIFLLSGIIYLSFLNSVFSQIPTPVLHPIDNNDGDHRYIVNWDSIPDVTSYSLFVDYTSEFKNFGAVNKGKKNEVSFAFQRKGTYYYRFYYRIDSVRSEWSNIESVTVLNDPPHYLTINIYANRGWNFEVSGEESGNPWASVSHYRSWDYPRGWVTYWNIDEAYWDSSRKYKGNGEIWEYYDSVHGVCAG